MAPAIPARDWRRSSRRSGALISSRIAIVDSGALYASADDHDQHHDQVLAVLRRPDLGLVVPALTVAEVSYLVGKRLGPRHEAALLRGLADFAVVAPSPADFVRMSELVLQYADFPLGGTDASIVALAERIGAEVIVTLDQRHFGSVRPP